MSPHTSGAVFRYSTIETRSFVMGADQRGRVIIAHAKGGLGVGGLRGVGGNGGLVTIDWV